MAAVNSGLLRPAALVGLGRISEIRGWHYQDGHALLGAGLTHARMGRPDFAALIPALAAAARAAGPAADPQRRHARRQHRHRRPHRRRAAGAGRPGGRPWSSRAPGGTRREIAGRHLLAGVRDAARPANSSASCGCRCCTPRRSSSRRPAAPAPAGPPPPSRSSSTRPGAACAARSGAVAPMPLRPLEAEHVGRLAHRLGRRTRPGARGADGLRRVRRRRLHPRPGAAARTARSRSPCRPRSCTCGVRSPRWPDAHWGGHCRER